MQVEVEVHVFITCSALCCSPVSRCSSSSSLHSFILCKHTHTLNALYITIAPVFIYTHIIIHVHYIIYCVLLIALHLSLPCSIVSLTDYYKKRQYLQLSIATPPLLPLLLKVIILTHYSVLLSPAQLQQYKPLQPLYLTVHYQHLSASEIIIIIIIIIKDRL